MDFADRCTEDLVAIGDFTLPGFAEKRSVFGLAAEA